MKRSKKWYGRVPASVCLDLSLSSDCLRVYTVMTLWVFQGNVAYIGMRQIGRLAKLSPATVMRRIQDLVKGGHIVVKKDENGKRSWYEFTSPVFGQKQAGVDGEVISYPRKRLAVARTA